MTNIGILENKISSAKKYLKILEAYIGVTEKEITSNFEKKGSIERYLYLMTQATIDLAEALISYRKLRKPSSFSENFEILRDENYISNDLCTKLIAMTGFRNVLAHGYEKVDYNVLLEILDDGRNDVIDFINIVEKII